MEAKQTPLIELLERVPQDARVLVEHDQFSSSSHPVGRLCHEAAAALREHMAEIHRLRAAGRQALDAMDYTRWAVADYAQKWGIPRHDAAMNTLRAALEPVTDCHDKEGDNLPLPLESKDLSEESLNEVVAQLKAATADRQSRINFTPTHTVLTGDTLDCLKKLADERDAPETNFGSMAQAVDSPAAYMMVNKAHGHTPSLHFTPPKDWHITWEAVPLYATPPKREPLTDEEITDLWDKQSFHLTDRHSVIDFVRDIERAHGIGNEK